MFARWSVTLYKAKLVSRCQTHIFLTSIPACPSSPPSSRTRTRQSRWTFSTRSSPSSTNWVTRRNSTGSRRLRSSSQPSWLPVDFFLVSWALQRDFWSQLGFVQYYREERNSKRKVLSCIFLVLFVLDFFVFCQTPSSWLHKKSHLFSKINWRAPLAQHSDI